MTGWRVWARTQDDWRVVAEGSRTACERGAADRATAAQKRDSDMQFVALPASCEIRALAHPTNPGPGETVLPLQIVQTKAGPVIRALCGLERAILDPRHRQNRLRNASPDISPGALIQMVMHAGQCTRCAYLALEAAAIQRPGSRAESPLTAAQTPAPAGAPDVRAVRPGGKGTARDGRDQEPVRDR